MTQNHQPWPHSVMRVSKHILNKMHARMQLIKKPERVFWVGLPADQPCNTEQGRQIDSFLTTVQLDNPGIEGKTSGPEEPFGGALAHLIFSNKSQVKARFQGVKNHLLPGAPLIFSAITALFWQDEGREGRLLLGQEALTSTQDLGQVCGGLGFEGVVLERCTVQCVFPDLTACREDMRSLLVGLFENDTASAEALHEQMTKITDGQDNEWQKCSISLEVILGCMFAPSREIAQTPGTIEIPIAEVKVRKG